MRHRFVVLAATTCTLGCASPFLSRKLCLQFEDENAKQCQEQMKIDGALGWWNRVKQRHVGNYENRIRFFAHPLKRFNYFASTLLPDGHWYMDSRDLIRSLIPFTGAYQYTAVSDWDSSSVQLPTFHHTTNEELKTHDVSQSEKSVKHAMNPKLIFAYQELAHLADTNGDGLISYDEYLLIMSMLSIKHHVFKTAFKLFDKDGDGSLNYHEFSSVLDSVDTPISERLGSREHQDYASRKDLNGILARLFGKHGNWSVKQHEFESLLANLKQLLLKCEFYRYQSVTTSWVKAASDSISGFDFGAAVLCYVHDDHRTKVDRLRKGEHRRVNFQEFEDFDKVAQSIDKLETGIYLLSQMSPHKNHIYHHHIGLNKSEFNKLVRACTGIALSESVIDILFSMFDDNGIAFNNVHQ